LLEGLTADNPESTAPISARPSRDQNAAPPAIPGGLIVADHRKLATAQAWQFRVASGRLRVHALVMFSVSETEAAAVRAAFDRGGELAAAVELRRLFPGITDNALARECARTIAGWKPLRSLPLRPRKPSTNVR
jgi:hypothetical protein